MERRRQQQIEQQGQLESPFPPRAAHVQVSQLASATATLSFSPFPSPEELAKYQQVSRDVLMAVMDQVKEQGTHRRALEVEAQKYSFTLAKRGQIFALATGLCGLGAVVALGYFGHPASAAIIGALDLLGLVAAFLRGPRKNTPPALPSG